MTTYSDEFIIRLIVDSASGSPAAESLLTQIAEQAVLQAQVGDASLAEQLSRIGQTMQTPGATPVGAPATQQMQGGPAPAPAPVPAPPATLQPTAGASRPATVPAPPAAEALRSQDPISSFAEGLPGIGPMIQGLAQDSPDLLLDLAADARAGGLQFGAELGSNLFAIPEGAAWPLIGLSGEMLNTPREAFREPAAAAPAPVGISNLYPPAAGAAPQGGGILEGIGDAGYGLLRAFGGSPLGQSYQENIADPVNAITTSADPALALGEAIFGVAGPAGEEAAAGGGLPVPDMTERFSMLSAALSQGRDPTASGTTGGIDLGPAPSLPAPPSLALPPPADFGPVREAIEGAKPERDALSGTLSGIAQGGIAGVQTGQNFGEALLMAGLGGIGGLAGAETGYDQAIQDYNLAVASAETGLIEAQRNEALSRAEAQYNASLRRWEFDVANAREQQPKFVGFQGGTMIYQVTDESGNRILKWDSTPGATVAMARANATAGGLGGDPINLVPEGYQITPGDPLGSAKEITANLFTAGQIQQVFGEEWEGMLSDAQEQVEAEFGAGVVSLQSEGGEDYRNMILSRALDTAAMMLVDDMASDNPIVFMGAIQALRPDLLYGASNGNDTGGTTPAPAGAGGSESALGLQFGP